MVKILCQVKIPKYYWTKNKVNNLSFTALSKYLSCPEEYNLYYNERIRLDQIGSPLYFGKAVDNALNTLLLTRDITKAKELFNTLFIDDKDVVYSEMDVDAEIITQEQYEQSPAYYSMKEVGNIILDSYNKEVMPKIKKVMAIQEETIITSVDGDKLKILPDLVCEWEDGTIILFDNKTSSLPYDNDSADKSIQLSLYYEILKDKYSLQKLGFIVMRKNLKKNRIKICSECGYDGSGARHSTCPNKKNNGRCGGIWNETIQPEAYIQIIINEPNQVFINNILDTTDKVNHNIKSKNFYKNLGACKRGKRLCDYYNLCHNNSMQGLNKKE